MAYARKSKGKAARTGAKPPVDRVAKRWCQEIERYERGSQKWREQALKVNKIYLDQHRDERSTDRRFAILWANIETMKPATYARRPQAVVSRRWERDAAGRKASELLERCINTTFDLYGIDDVMQGVRDDRLLSARGTAWVRYEAEFEAVDDAAAAEGDAAGETDGAEGEGAAPAERVASEKVCNEFVHWTDFGHVLARTWSEVPAVWRRVYMTKAKVQARKFANKEAVAALRYEVRPENTDKGDNDAGEQQCIIYEIWDKDGREVIWLNKESEQVLEQGEPPLNLRNFFPCPKPVYGTRSTRSLIPVCDYRYYQDQAEEIDDLTAKISALTGWLRLKGFIRRGVSSEGGDAADMLLKLEQSLTSRGDAILVPVESWAGFAENGGAKGIIEWLPLDQVVTALREAIAARREIKSDVFELTGISDILRGETDPNETLGAQQIKAQTGSRRIATTQRDLARFARDLAELNGEVIAEVFSPETMSEMSGLDMTIEPPPEMMARVMFLRQATRPQPPQPPEPMMATPPAPMPPGGGAGQPGAMAQPPAPDPAMVDELKKLEEQLEGFKLNAQVLELLRDEKTRGFRIEIETDSTIEPDEQAEKQRRVELVEAVGSFMERALPVVTAQPKLLPVIKELLMFLVRGFRAGRAMEDVIERAFEQLEQAANQPHEPQPDPKVIKAQLDAKNKAAQIQQAGQLAARGQDINAAVAKRGQDVDAAVVTHGHRQDAALSALDALGNAAQPPGVT